MKQLRELASLYQPLTISAKQFTESGFPVYGANGVVGYYHSANHDTWQVTVTCRGSTCGTVNRTVDHCWITGNAMVLNCDRHDGLIKDFFYHLVCSQDFSNCITGTGQPQIVRTPIADFRVALPPSVAEQRAIAEALSDVDALLGALDQLIAKKRDLKQAAMQQLLTGQIRLPGFHGAWGAKRLGDVGVFLKGAGIKKDEVVADGPPCIRYGEIYTHHNDHLKAFNSFITPATAAQSQRIQKGDLLFAGSGETAEEIGKCVAFLWDQEAYAGGDIVILRPNGQSSEFLGYLMNHSSVVAQKTRMGQGDAVVHISARNLARLELHLPPLPEQTAIAEVLSDMDAELAALARRRDQTRALKQGMMHSLLTGKIRLI